MNSFIVFLQIRCIYYIVVQSRADNFLFQMKIKLLNIFTYVVAITGVFYADVYFCKVLREFFTRKLTPTYAELFFTNITRCN